MAYDLGSPICVGAFQAKAMEEGHSRLRAGHAKRQRNKSVWTVRPGELDSHMLGADDSTLQSQGQAGRSWGLGKEFGLNSVTTGGCFQIPTS